MAHSYPRLRGMALKSRRSRMGPTLGADNETSRCSETSCRISRPAALEVVSSVVPVHPAGGYAVDDSSENADRQAIHYRQLGRRELAIGDALAQHNENIPGSSTEGVRIDARNERW